MAKVSCANADMVLHLEGSTWKLQQVDGPDGSPTGNVSLEVSDCISECTVDTLDIDGRAGYLLVDDLPFGWYKLTEEKAPDGYIRDSEPKYIEVTDKNIENPAEFDPINNEPIAPPTIPKTGGIGLIPGMLLGLLVVGGGGYLARRRRA